MPELALAGVDVLVPELRRRDALVLEALEAENVLTEWADDHVVVVDGLRVFALAGVVIGAAVLGAEDLLAELASKG